MEILPDRAKMPLEQVFRKFVRTALIEHFFERLRRADRARRRDSHKETDTDRHGPKDEHGQALKQQTDEPKTHKAARNDETAPETLK